MGSALDEAERALVTGSWSKASDAAATARRVARTAPDRVAAECVWVQAEYKLGRLGETHEADARRVTGVGGDPLEPHTLLLWSRLKLADAPRGQQKTREDERTSRRAEASVSDALAGVFREARRRRREPRSRAPRGGSAADDLEAEIDGDASAHALDDTHTVSAAAWLYCVDVLCARRRDPRAAADWLRANFAELASPARERLVDVVSLAEKEKRKREAEEGVSSEPSSRGGGGACSITETRDINTPQSRGGGGAARADGASANERGGDEDDDATNEPEPGSSPARRSKQRTLTRWSDAARSTLDAGLGAIVETANASFGVSLDPANAATRLGAAAAAAAAAVVAYAIVAETTRTRNRRRS